MAEAVAVISIITNIIALINFSAGIYNSAKDLSDGSKDIPKAFRNISHVLPLVSDSLRKTQEQIESGEIDESSCGGLKPSLESCKDIVLELNNLFKKVLPSDNASKLSRGWKAVSSMVIDKKVEDLNKAMMQYVGVITLYHVSNRIQKPNSTRKPLFMVPYRNEEFIGRNDILAEVAQGFKARAPRIAISGIGGVGKSCIAIEYCYRHRSENPDAHVFWIHGGSIARFEAAYRDIATKLRIPGFAEPQVDILSLVSDWLSQEENGNWVMVLDNADNAKIWDGSGSGSSVTPIPPLIRYLPRGEHGFVLITTRDAQLGKILSRTGRPKKPIEVLPFSSSDAVSLLRSRISEDNHITENDAQELTQALDYLPLAITQAAAYLDLNDMPVAKYLQLIENSDLLSQETYDDIRDPDIQNSVFKTLKLSFDYISEQWPRAGEILSLMAMFDRQEISIGLVTKKNEDDILNFDFAISKLKALSLIEEPKTKTFSMHRIVHLSIQWYLKQRGCLKTWQEKALEFIDYCFPQSSFGDPERHLSSADWAADWGIIETLNPHTQIVLDYIFINEPCLLAQARVESVLASYLLQQYRPITPIAIEYLSHSLKIRENILGSEHYETLESMSTLAYALTKIGLLEDAEKIIRRAFEMSAKQYSDPRAKHDTASYYWRILSIFIDVLSERKKYEEAEIVIDQAIGLFDTAKGHKHYLTLLTKGSLAYLRLCQGRFCEAEQIYRKVLTIYIQCYGTENFWALCSMDQLACALYYQFRFKEAEIIFRDVVSIKKNILGLTSGSTIRSMEWFANSLYNLQRYDEAKSIAEECLNNCVAFLDHMDPQTNAIRALIAEIDSALENLQTLETKRADRSISTNEKLEVLNSKSLQSLNQDTKIAEDGTAIQEDQPRENKMQQSFGALRLSG